jgi:polyhydroxyalkanoate synthesis regulator phasin
MFEVQASQIEKLMQELSKEREERMALAEDVHKLREKVLRLEQALH